MAHTPDGNQTSPDLLPLWLLQSNPDDQPGCPSTDRAGQTDMSCIATVAAGLKPWPAASPVPVAV